MAKYLLKKYFPKLIIIEGLWGSGKTTFAHYLVNKYSLIFIREPLYRGFLKEGDASQWYFDKHLDRHIQVRKMNLKEKIVMERSIISNAAYRYAKVGHLNRHYRNTLIKFPELHYSTIVFLFGESSLFESRAGKYSNLPKININLKRIFIKRYIEFYRSILPKIINNRPIFLITKKNGRFLTTKRIFADFKKDYLSKINDKKNETIKSGSAIIFYKNRVLLMFDKKWKHYVFPQGRAKKGESVIVATTREIREETGFYDVETLISLPTYNYYYQESNSLIRKQVKVFVFKLRSLKRFGKSLEPHENYQNRFVSFKKAMNLLKWPEDKVVLKEAKKRTHLSLDKRVH